MAKLDVHVLIKGFQGIIDDVQVFTDLEKAKKEFKEYAGITEEEMLEDYDLLGDNEPTKIVSTVVEIDFEKDICPVCDECITSEELIGWNDNAELIYYCPHCDTGLRALTKLVVDIE